MKVYIVEYLSGVKEVVKAASLMEVVKVSRGKKGIHSVTRDNSRDMVPFPEMWRSVNRHA